jgi:hypothetical protein
VKLADSHKGISQQTQLPTAVVPMALPMATAYQQPGNAHPGTLPVGYSYPQTVASYPAPSFPSPPAPAPYQTQAQIHYAPVNLKKETPWTPISTSGVRSQGFGFSGWSNQGLLRTNLMSVAKSKGHRIHGSCLLFELPFDLIQ